MDCSPPGSSVHGILQARILEWIAIPFSRRTSQPRDWTWVSHIAGRFFTVWTTRDICLYRKAFLHWLKNSQSQLRTDSYSYPDVCLYLPCLPHKDETGPGCRVILPQCGSSRFGQKYSRAKLFHLAQPPTQWPVVLGGQLDRCKPWWTSGKILLGTKFVPGNHDGPRVEKVSEIQDWSGKKPQPPLHVFFFP